MEGGGGGLREEEGGGGRWRAVLPKSFELQLLV